MSLNAASAVVWPQMFADECADRLITEALRRAGADVLLAGDFARGDDDRVVIERATHRQRIVLTEDFDIGDLTIRDGQRALGVVLISIFRISRQAKADIELREIVKHHDALVGNLLIVEPARSRLRPLP